MKIAIVGDCHFGARSDKLTFHKYFKRFYQEYMFPYLWEHDIKEVIQTGDLFDRRKYVNYNTLFQSKKYFFNEFGKNGMRLHTFPGNHDIFLKNSLKINSIDSNLQDFIRAGSIINYSNPTTVEFDDTNIDMIPWICEENEKDVVKFIENSKSQVCIGHFELNGFCMERGHVHQGGSWDRERLKKYEIVLSGHFHHKSTDGHIWYVGTPYELSWSDFDDPRGFHIFDTSTRELSFIENPFKMHKKISYDDTDLDMQKIAGLDLTAYAECIVKVVVVEKRNPVMFDAFMDALYAVNPLEISIVENFVPNNDILSINQSDDTLTLVGKTIDGIDTGALDKNVLKSMLREIYVEAQSYAD